MERSAHPQIADGELDVQLKHDLMHDRYVPSMFLTLLQWRYLTLFAVLCVPSGSRQTASTLPRVAIGPRKSTTPRRAPRHGESFSFVKVYLSNLG